LKLATSEERRVEEFTSTRKIAKDWIFASGPGRGCFMDYENILLEKKDGIARITLNRPDAMNAMNRAMITEIGRALEDVEEDETVRVVILTGKGKAFCVGADLKAAAEEMGTLSQQEAWFRWANKNTMERLAHLSKPVIAAINGFAFAGGCELMMACDLAIAAEDAVICDQHINFGLVGPGGSTQRTTWLVGARRAKEIIFTGKRLSGKDAERIGLVNQAVSGDKLDETVKDLAALLCEKSPVALRIAKSLINQASQTDLSLSQELEVMSSIVNCASEDYSEGMRAFNEKRKPIFKGR
jgi:enoyl-CoA hydratase/carnithine racemase